MNPYIQNYLDLLWKMFQYDIDKLSQPWMYYWVLVPVMFYLVFFFVKWTVLTTPLWLPLTIVLQSFRRKCVRKP
ncbi:MAG TPA: hypothetical protein VHP36_08700 [Chitinispirillaceae bacterium]|nr:hypothetical protein [Chitinispirillaceae bacterium]